MTIKLKIFSVIILCMLVQPGTALAQFGLNYVHTASGTKSANIRTLNQWSHARLVFNKDLDRVAVGQASIMDVEVLNAREVLVLPKEVGRTSIIVWYPDGSTESFLFSVTTDISMLSGVLREIHPNITIELARDRAVMVLRGVVPTVRHRAAAEAAARNYLSADPRSDTGTSNALVQSVTDGQRDFRVSAESTSGESTAGLINLIQTEQLPATSAEKIIDAIASIGGRDVTVRRIVHGDVASDTADTLLLEGSVENQVALSRVLNVAARLFLGNDNGAAANNVVEAVADETGALIEQREDQQISSNGASTGQGFGGSQSLQNEVKANIGRATLLSIANGRILSVIQVRDLPQVRVSVQIHEVNRRRLNNWRPDLSLVSRDFAADSFGLAGNRSSDNGGAPVSSNDLEGALQVLGGALTTSLQRGGSNIAFDLLFSLLEQEGISTTLSRPTLTVLAGESAVFQVGGEVPVPSSFAPTGVSPDGTPGGASQGVFSSTEFRSFGVQLKVRAMVGEDDKITLDINPTVSVPDAGLTALIADTTGAALNTSAFNTRSLQTTTRLSDGQPLVIAGLVSRDLADNKAYTPKVHKVPGLGWLAKSSSTADEDRELIIIVTPTIVREPIENTALWQFPTTRQLLRATVGMFKLDRHASPISLLSAEQDQ